MYIAEPCSRAALRRLALTIREVINCENQLNFPILQFVEIIMPTIDDGFNFGIGLMEDMGNNHGLTEPENKTIIIREDVYEGALRGRGRDRLTIAHEVGHYYLHPASKVSFARTRKSVPAYMDPEWQATAFAGELLVPAHLVRGLTTGIISVECGVSHEAALTQLRTIR